MELTNLSAASMADLLASRATSAVEIAESHLKRIEEKDSDLGCFLTIDRDGVLEQAKQAQKTIDEGNGGPLTGIPVAIKDNISTMGVRTTCASKILENYVPPFDATVVKRLKSAGCVILGKTNLDEFAMGTSTETSAFQRTRNPWDPTRSPGGSSGGSAAAVSGGLSPLALGSDTGGSIRQPASLCGVVGFKPTYGRCSRYGLVAFGSSLDQIGPLARTVRDAAQLASTITGHDPDDNTSLPMPSIDLSALGTGSLKSLKVGVPKELMSGNLSAGVQASVENALKLLEAEGAVVSYLTLPSIKLGVTTYYIIAPAEASSNLARFDGIRYGSHLDAEGHIGATERTRGHLFGHEVKARIMIGAYALSAGYYDAYYVRAQQVRALMCQEFAAAFESVDLIVSPTSPITAFKLGELNNDPLALKLLDYCTIPANMNGMPAISLNCGLAEGLPVGLQLMAPPTRDEFLLQCATKVEEVLGATVSPPAA